MKNYSIGRDEGCSIIISDPSKMVSRNHATLTIDGTKMTITDHSSNGTYINSIKISSNTPVPVTRRDVISFANVSNLDWSKVPNPLARIILIVAIAIVVVASLCVASYYWNQSKNQEQQINNNEKMEQMRADSLKNAALEKRIASLKASSDTLIRDYNALNERFTQLNKAIDSKVQNKALKEIIKSVGSIEEALKSIDADGFKISVEKVEGNFRDKVKETPDRVEKLEKQLSDYQSVISDASQKINDIENRLKKIPNREKKEETVKKEPEKERQDTAVMGPKRFF